MIITLVRVLQTHQESFKYFVYSCFTQLNFRVDVTSEHCALKQKPNYSLNFSFINHYGVNDRNNVLKSYFLERFLTFIFKLYIFEILD